MADRIDLNEAYMRMAEVWAMRAYAERAKVGALLVKDGQVVSDGYNGNLAGFPHGELETKDEHGNIVTSPYCLHAESNALMKLARNGSSVSSENADMYVTMSPCPDCVKLIIQARIKRVYYRTEYRRTEGLPVLRRAGIEVIHLPANETIPHLVYRVYSSWTAPFRRFLARLILR
jgi:dCMP deaminase